MMFDEYFESIELSKLLRKRVETLYQRYTAIIPAEKVPHIFIENSIDDEGNRNWGSLWVYGPDYAGEFKNFQLQDKFDGCKVRAITRWECTVDNFVIGEDPLTNSRFHLHWMLESSVSGEMPATGANCAQLSHFFKEVILSKEVAA